MTMPQHKKLVNRRNRRTALSKIIRKIDLNEPYVKVNTFSVAANDLLVQACLVFRDQLFGTRASL